MKKTPGYIIILHICTINDYHMMYGSWDMERNRHNFLSFWTVFALLPHWQPKNSKFWKNEKKHLVILSFYTCVPEMTIIWCMVPEIWSLIDTTFCHFSPFIALIPPPNNLKNQNFEKMKQPPGDIITLHMCIINDNHMMYGSWDTECDWHNFLSFWTVFCSFTPPTTRKIKILKNWRKHQEISSLYNSEPKITTICYTVPEIWYVTDVFIFHFGLFFAL